MQTPLQDTGPVGTAGHAAHPPVPARVPPTERAGPSVARPVPVSLSARRLAYRRVLAWAFALFSSVRMVAYLPTIAAIWHSHDASQHSLATWLTWFGANVTMALHLLEHDEGRSTRAVWVNAGNAAMCLVTALLIVAFR